MRGSAGEHGRLAASHTLPDGKYMNLRFIDWIWHVRGSVPLAPQQSSDEAFERLDPMFQQPNTTYERDGDTLTFTKRDQAAQDRMSIFDAGVLQVEQGPAGPLLRYHMTSKALLFCFLAPLLFLCFAQLAHYMNTIETPADKAEETKKKPETKKPVQLHPIDVALGAPAPEDPAEKEKEKEKNKEKDKDKGKHSPTPAYVFAAIFATLYVAGRILEDWLIKRRFKRRLHEA